MTPTTQRKTYDCGRVSAANHAATVTSKDADDLYEQTGSFGQPRFPLLTDLWDSPSRQVAMIAALTGQCAGLVPIDPIMVPSAVLIRIGWTTWHWVTVLRVTGRGLEWHDGIRGIVTDKTIEERFPGAVVVLAVAAGSIEPLPWYWRLWGTVTWPVRRLW